LNKNYILYNKTKKRVTHKGKREGEKKKKENLIIYIRPAYGEKKNKNTQKRYSVLFFLRWKREGEIIETNKKIL